VVRGGADINAEDEEGETALDRTVSRRCEVVAKLGQEYPHTKILEAVVLLLRKAHGNVEGSEVSREGRGEIVQFVVLVPSRVLYALATVNAQRGLIVLLLCQDCTKAKRCRRNRLTGLITNNIISYISE